MMKLNLYYKTVAFFFIIMMPINIVSQEKVSKQIKRTYAFSEKSKLFINNKYGDIFINGWDKNSIKIIVDIEAKGKNITITKELLSRIEPNIKVLENFIRIQSEITKKEKSLFNRFIKKVDPFTNEKANSQINYTIYLPKNAEVELNNKYGDIIISDWYGNLNAKVEHGDLRLFDAMKNANLTVKYGKLKANTLIDTKIFAKDASIDIDRSEQLSLNTNGSDINLESVSSLELYSNKDEIKINDLKNVNGTVKYSTILLNNVQEKIILDLHLAELRTLRFSKPFPTVIINQQSSDIYLNISNTSFTFSASLEQGVLRIPKVLQNINTEIIDKKKKIRNISAIYGNPNGGRFSFTGIKGVIILKEL